MNALGYGCVAAGIRTGLNANGIFPGVIVQFRGDASFARIIRVIWEEILIWELDCSIFDRGRVQFGFSCSPSFDSKAGPV